MIRRPPRIIFWRLRAMKKRPRSMWALAFPKWRKRLYCLLCFILIGWKASPLYGEGPFLFDVRHVCRGRHGLGSVSKIHFRTLACAIFGFAAAALGSGATAGGCFLHYVIEGLHWRPSSLVDVEESLRGASAREFGADEARQLAAFDVGAVGVSPAAGRVRQQAGRHTGRKPFYHDVGP